MIQLKVLDDNQVEKPDIEFNKHDALCLIIKNVDNVSNLHCSLKIKFSENHIVEVEIESIIFPFDFGFDLYDYCKKEYVTDSTILYSEKYIDREIVLHCRLYGIFTSEVNALIQNNFSSPVSIVSAPEKLAIKDDTEFDIKIKLENRIPSFNDQFYQISVNIRNIEKTIKFHFEEEPYICRFMMFSLPTY